jgi:putative transposase
VDAVVRQVDLAIRETAVARLRAKRATGAPISADVRRVAAALLVAESTVWRWLATSSDAPVTRIGYRLSEADRDAYVDWCGNVAALRRARLARGERHQVYLRWESPGRNARWEGDQKELPVLVTPPRGVRPCKPWVTLFLDCYSRLIMGWALSLRPNSATVLATFRCGLVVDPARGAFGGVPVSLVPDHGLEFATTALKRVCDVLGVALEPTDAYAPHQKGKLERANRTLDQEFLCGLPFFTDGRARWTADCSARIPRR